MNQQITDMNEDSNFSSLTMSFDQNNSLPFDPIATFSNVEQSIVEDVDQLEENDENYIADLNENVQEILSLISEHLWGELQYANAASIVEHPKIVRNLNLNHYIYFFIFFVNYTKYV